MDTRSHSQNATLGWWRHNGTLPSSREETLQEAIYDIHRPVAIVAKDGKYALAESGVALMGEGENNAGGLPIAAYVPACPLKNLGDATFCANYGLEYPYLAGSMANGICSAEIVEAMGRGGMLGFFGAAGLPLQAIEAAIDRIASSLGDRPFGFNLIHSPNDPDLEAAVADLYLRRNIRLVEASAYLDLTLPVVRYRVHGIYQDPSGRIITPNRIIAKASRVEVASKFFAPPPEEFLTTLVASGDITEEQAGLAGRIPMAQDLTAEADSGGHTDNRPAITLLPTLLALRDRLQAEYGYEEPLRVGAAGGIATPASASAAFSMGAAYVLTGTINQGAVEAGTSDMVREMLAETKQADITMAPAADMFEMGVRVQVLKRGTMFAMRAARLYDIYHRCESLEAIPPAERNTLERSIFRAPLERIWEETRTYFQERDPRQIARADSDPKHRMALVFRWYLGQASRWATLGDASRKIDCQVWCGPAMGAFNAWVKGSFLEDPKNRRVVTIALNILYGTAVIVRLNSLRYQGVSLPPEWVVLKPLRLEKIMDIVK